MALPSSGDESHATCWCYPCEEVKGHATMKFAVWFVSWVVSSWALIAIAVITDTGGGIIWPVFLIVVAAFLAFFFTMAVWSAYGLLRDRERQQH